MADLALQFGGDLMVSASGDLATLDDQALVQQRVLRRLLTNPGDYIWQLGYGAGLGQFIGQPAALSLMAGLVRAQMQREPQVMQSPPPTVSMSMADDGTVNATVSYVDAATGQTASLSFSI
ncbi:MULTISPECIES: hypothetical protein [unclassified Acidocella]|uniref:hypothetical protein n=1 Tax=unclassified Acidocella TaxID=2648610 RepID=UPI00028D765B|nr:MULTISPECIES: hypothetical protein [unclassified Acidocella]EKM99020.1 hypothetical protein MXAZACID_12402 [Acidocella sp. MX-AZ02]WBO58533.1 hypothetical protein GT370_15345 [Acidocella sp. MX-AZ03]